MDCVPSLERMSPYPPFYQHIYTGWVWPYSGWVWFKVWLVHCLKMASAPELVESHVPAGEDCLDKSIDFGTQGLIAGESS